MGAKSKDVKNYEKVLDEKDLGDWSNKSQNSKGGIVLHNHSNEKNFIKKSCGCRMGDKNCKHPYIPLDTVCPV